MYLYLKTTFLLFLTLILLPQILQGNEYANISGTGFGVTRDIAITKAKIDALEKSVGVLLSSKSVVENYMTISDKIIKKSNGFVKKYKIVKEKQYKEDGLFEIEISAEITDILDKLIQDKIALKFLLSEIGFPAFSVVMLNSQYERDRATEGLIKKKLLKMGFKLKHVSVKDIDDMDEFKKKGIDFVLRGSIDYETVSLENIYNIKSMKSFQTSLECEVINTSSSEIISSEVLTGKAAHISEKTAKIKALEKAIPKLANYLILESVGKWSGEVAESLNEIDFTITNISSLNGEIIFKKLLTNFNGVESITDKGYADKVQNLFIKTYFTPSDIADLIRKNSDLRNFKFDIIKKDRKNLVIKML